MDTARTLESLLIFGVFPLWMLAGVADWFCHRASDIERTSGSRESQLHLLLFAEIAIPIAAITLLHVTTPVLLLFAVGVIAHFATSWADTNYAQPKRFISPLEQQVHSFLEMLPLFGLILLAVLVRDQLTEPDWRLVARGFAWPGAHAVIGALCLGAAFILEEWWRCARRSWSARGSRAA
jgi:hypothetical protein